MCVFNAFTYLKLVEGHFKRRTGLRHQGNIKEREKSGGKNVLI